MPERDFHPLSILLVDDNPFDSQLLFGILKAFDFGNVIAASSVDDAMRELGQSKIDCILLDWAMKPRDGLDLVRAVRQSQSGIDPKIPIILCSSYTELHRVIKARDTGVDEVLAKPYSPMQLYHKLGAAIFQQRPFIAVDTFTGPDRRRHKDAWTGPERRGKHGLSQEQIDRIMHENDLAVVGS